MLEDIIHSQPAFPTTRKSNGVFDLSCFRVCVTRETNGTMLWFCDGETGPKFPLGWTGRRESEELIRIIILLNETVRENLKLVAQDNRPGTIRNIIETLKQNLPKDFLRVGE